MGFREVSVVEVREVLRAWLDGVRKEGLLPVNGRSSGSARLNGKQLVGLRGAADFGTGRTGFGGWPWPDDADNGRLRGIRGHL